MRDVEQKYPAHHSLDNYPYSDGDWSTSDRYLLPKDAIPNINILTK